MAFVGAFGDGQSLMYCKFINASPGFFRASIACFGTPNDSDNVALPAR